MSQSIHNITQRRTQLLAVILYVHCGLQGTVGRLNADWLLRYVTQEVNADRLLCNVTQEVNADWLLRYVTQEVNADWLSSHDCRCSSNI